ncbi:hydroxymethylglutaryl-CoA synthase [Phytophthora nicotianae INRA-310]|uniref:Hydroxymethylglutaryl-CoA synthase n=2 Tax=Phytophthora nicotianae TaxID=4792 RepID=W2QIJ9_PHYN3|nr:hydroxymethylglutaryl-CoA synthase [Phytophthora nicotianae INRA-310]ETN12090.1 hydroxymethylglutaryl-CoA synthase [Phytophthora nicotianae INRA-310]
MVSSARPSDVGILAMEVHFPSDFVDQREMETFDGVGSGKYTLGLGQLGMAVPGDREDVNALALTAVSRLMSKFQVSPEQVGRLEVGTETLVDKSKSTKTVLMQLFGDNTDVDGATVINACYGGTAALLNAVAWVDSSFWDGRYAIVVATDIAVYAKGPARPSGGCGAVAMLIGPDAPMVLDCRTKSTHATNVWDFYKPNVSSEYPTVDGKLSNSCYLHALDECYQLFCKKSEGTANGKAPGVASVDYAVFHSPYNKLVQKSFARLLFLDSRRSLKTGDEAAKEKFAQLAKWVDTPLEETLNDRELDLAVRGVAKEDFNTKVSPSCTTSQQLGNCYTAAVYMNLATLVHARAKDLALGSRVLMFSYGSGSLATMFVLRTREPAERKFSLENIAKSLDLTARLERRNKKTPEEYTARMKLREKTYGAKNGVKLTQSIASIPEGEFYLDRIDEMGRRFYARSKPQVTSEGDNQEQQRLVKSTQELAGAVYVAGTSVGLPGQAKVFEGEKSIEKLLQGENCICELSDKDKDRMVAQNITQVHKDKATGEVTRSPVSTHDKCIQVSAVVNDVDLEKDYGIAATIANSMDKPTQLAVAAGLEAVRNAGLVDGVNGNWRLPESMRDSTGVIYATSFPTMNAAVSETSRYYEEKEGESAYEMDRKILFRLLVLANAQVAQLTGARGLNTQINAACAGATQAIGMAQDWINSGKCQRVIVVSSDTASSETMMPLIGGGFRALGAACIAPTAETAARPFDVKRSGMIVGSGAIGVVLESPLAFAERQVAEPATGKTVRLLATQFSNSAYHGAALEPNHVGQELVRFLQRVESDFGITREEIARNGVYYSHETGTNASPKSSCAYTEVTALRTAFGSELLSKLTIANTKGFTGHPMAVSFEDVAAIEGLRSGRVPPVVHFETHDSNLGETPLRLATGEAYAHKYALHFAAGFGSQLAFTLYTLEN